MTTDLGAALRDATLGLPLDIRFTIPSCVPASPMESPGGEISAADIDRMRSWPETVALGEMMNFPGVLDADPDIAAQLWQSRDIPIDGHAPALRGPDLAAYVAAGISSDHESFELDEAREKLAAGMFIMLRQGSSEKNLLKRGGQVAGQSITASCKESLTPTFPSGAMSTLQ